MTALLLRDARSFAKKSSYDLLAYVDRKAQRISGRVTASFVKAALLASGHFTIYSARTARGHRINWRPGVTYFANLRRGTYAHG